jgi:hypothetical protein
MQIGNCVGNRHQQSRSCLNALRVVQKYRKPAHLQSSSRAPTYCGQLGRCLMGEET